MRFLRRLGAAPADQARARRPLPDPSRPPRRRGTWEEAALTNVDVTEYVKRQLDTPTPPWKK